MNRPKLFSMLLLFAALLNAKTCDRQLFTISSEKGITASEMLEQLGVQCRFNIVVKDTKAHELLDKPLYRFSLNSATLKEILDLMITETGLSYELTGSALKISSLETKSYRVDYIGTLRGGTSKTEITLSSSTSSNMSLSGSSSSSGSSNNASMMANSANSSSGINITADDKFIFWDRIEKDLLATANTPQDDYKIEPPVINKEAGLITVTATRAQHERIQKYLDDLLFRIQKQVMIDVNIYEVTLDTGNTTGIDWSQIYNFQNMQIGYGTARTSGIDTTTVDLTLGGSSGDAMTANSDNSSYFILNKTITINNLIAFLRSQGDVKSVSNPKITTLNNQPAVISSGDQLYYKLQSTTSTSSTTTTTSSSEILGSIFAGILLDITPQVDDENQIMLKVNPSISSCRDTTQCTSSMTLIRTMPPDLVKKEMSAVIRVKEGDRVVIGGLISDADSFTIKKVPLFGDIPLLGYLFKQEVGSRAVKELVIIITAHLVTPSKVSPSLKELGYERMDDFDKPAKEPKKEELPKGGESTKESPAL